VLVLLSVLSLAVADEEVCRFDGYKVLRLKHAPETLLGFQDLLPEWGMVDWWREATPAVDKNGHSSADVMVPPEHLQQVIRMLSESNITYSVMIEDVQHHMELQLVPSSNDAADWFTSYHKYDDTVVWLKELAKNYSSIADLVVIGTSYEGRTIYGLHITGQRQLNAAKPGIFNDGGIHAREWISPATIGYLTYQLLSLYGKDATVTKLVDSIEWTMVPIFNTDGYEFTWKSDRMWRKTRMPNAGTSCVGTDPCRNCPTGWGGGGSSSSPCSDTYRGKAAFDQPEVKAIAEYVKKLGNVKYYNNFHSYSQLWMGPWGYTFTPPPQADLSVQNAVGKIATDAIKKSHGLTYEYGPVAPTIYQASGIMCDEIYKASGVVLSYTCELRDTGSYGFLLPPAQIKPQGEEIWAATVLIAQYVLDHVHEL